MRTWEQARKDMLKNSELSKLVKRNKWLRSVTIGWLKIKQRFSKKDGYRVWGDVWEIHGLSFSDSDFRKMANYLRLKSGGYYIGVQDGKEQALITPDEWRYYE